MAPSDPVINGVVHKAPPKNKPPKNAVRHGRRGHRPTRTFGTNFYSSIEWMKARYAAFARDGNLCQCCGATSKDGVLLQVAHLKPRSFFPELALDISNLQVVCEPCRRRNYEQRRTKGAIIQPG